MESYLAALSATIAAVVSVMNYYQSISLSKDSIKVSLGTRRFEPRPGDDLNIISMRKHKTIVVDYGFIDLDGYLHSMVVLAELEHMYSEESFVDGSLVMQQPSDFFEFGLLDSPVEGVCGAFAKTSSSKKLFYSFSASMPLHKRLLVRMKLYRNIVNRFFTGSILYK